MDQQRTISFQGQFFRWLISLPANNMWCADGRANVKYRIGKFSLGCGPEDDFRPKLLELDREIAIKLGLVAIPEPPLASGSLLLADGIQRYLEHGSQTEPSRGAHFQTLARYKAILQNFQTFAKQQTIRTWAQMNEGVLAAYSKHLKDRGYQPRTITLELTTIKQATKFLVQEGHLKIDPISSNAGSGLRKHHQRSLRQRRTRAGP